MKYVGIYWTLFAPKIKRSIKKRYSMELAQRAIKNGKGEYRRLLERAEDLGKGNPMAMNAYFAYVFVGAWLGTDKEIPPKGMADVMTDVLYEMKPFFGLININSKRGETKWYRSMKKYEKWYESNGNMYPTTWKVKFNENLHKDGSFYYFTKCPICDFCNKEGLTDIMPYLCQTDKVMFEFQHGILHRDCTLAAGDSMCDYWVVGDKVKNPK